MGELQRRHSDNMHALKFPHLEPPPQAKGFTKLLLFILEVVHKFSWQKQAIITPNEYYTSTQDTLHSFE